MEKPDGNSFVSDNPVTTDGFAFLEFTSVNSNQLADLFARIGFVEIGRHRNKAIRLFSQGKIKFLLNDQTVGSAKNFRDVHQQGTCSMGFFVKDSGRCFDEVVNRGATPAGNPEFDIPAIEGVGGSLIYLMDLSKEKSFFEEEFEITAAELSPKTMLIDIDHVTHNVTRGYLNSWAEFYEKLFDFKKVRTFEIKGRKTGLLSHAMVSPCGKIRIPLNESCDQESQIEEFLAQHNGDGIQHIALSSADIYQTVRTIKMRGVPFQTTPDTYYDLIDSRLPGHGEDIEMMHELGILVDGGEKQGGGKLLQIFTTNAIGPVFFEFIQRKGNQGFGDGNFQALFESIELDQIRRGVITAA
jgi:4-hydroxyphenylpyruvate dioxygenase